MSDRDLIVQQMADILESAPRQGGDTDAPEGTRYITISDTLAKQMARLLRAEAAIDEAKKPGDK